MKLLMSKKYFKKAVEKDLEKLQFLVDYLRLKRCV